MSNETHSEIGLVDFIQLLRSEYLLIGLVWSSVVAIGAFYVWWATPTYRAEALLLPPLPQDVMVKGRHGLPVEKNVLEQLEITEPDVEAAYEAFKLNLISTRLRLVFFEDHNMDDIYREFLPGLREKTTDWVFHEHFSVDLRVHHPSNSRSSPFLRVSFDFPDPEAARDTVNGFVEMVALETARELATPFRLRTDSRVAALKEEIQRVQSEALTSIDDRLAMLDEATGLAEKLGIEERSDSLVRTVDGLGISVNTSSAPTYERGGKALRAERDAIEKRKGRDEFVRGLRDLQRDLARFQEVEWADNAGIRSVRVDQAAHAPIRPESPRRLLILAFSLASGLLLGILAAVVRGLFRKMA